MKNLDGYLEFLKEKRKAKKSGHSQKSSETLKQLELDYNRLVKKSNILLMIDELLEDIEDIQVPGRFGTVHTWLDMARYDVLSNNFKDSYICVEKLRQAFSNDARYKEIMNKFLELELLFIPK